jgi:OOP family OmpA-OmpF porin
VLVLLLALGCGGAPAPATEDPSATEPGETAPAETPPDPDSDGLASDVDACPCMAEDVDGFDDADGCPELDNDQDGMHDACDACPNEAETYLHADTREGCPDTAGVVAESATLAPDHTIYFTAQSSRISAQALPVVDAVALVLAENPRFVRVAVQGNAATNERGAEALAVARATAVHAALVERGVDPGRLLIVGQGSDQPLDPGTTREAHARNRRVTFVVDQVTPEEPDPNARASVSDCDVPAPVDHCAAGGSAGGG